MVRCISPLSESRNTSSANTRPRVVAVRSTAAVIANSVYFSGLMPRSTCLPECHVVSQKEKTKTRHAHSDSHSLEHVQRNVNGNNRLFRFQLSQIVDERVPNKKKKMMRKKKKTFFFFSQVTKEGLLGALLEGFDTHFGEV
jgi:hypothetical protein